MHVLSSRSISNNDVSNIIDMVRLLFRKDKKPYLQLKEILGFYPRNIRVYQLALKHKSVAHFEREEMKAKGELPKDASRKSKAKEKSVEATSGRTNNGKTTNGKANGKGRKAEKNGKSGKGFQYTQSLNNERLEFLGDAILGAVVADILYRHFGNKQEGFLTNLRSKIVCRKSLNELAVKLGLDKLVQHTGVITTGHNSFMNGNAFEAFFGAIYLDRGYAYCYRFMEQKVFKKYINVDDLSTKEENFKSKLIEWCQKYQYKFDFVRREVRDGNVPRFLSELYIEGAKIGKGQGYSKKESDQAAAKDALRKIADRNTINRIKSACAENKRKLAEAKACEENEAKSAETAV